MDVSAINVVIRSVEELRVEEHTHVHVHEQPSVTVQVREYTYIEHYIMLPGIHIHTYRKDGLDIGGKLHLAVKRLNILLLCQLDGWSTHVS